MFVKVVLSQPLKTGSSKHIVTPLQNIYKSAMPGMAPLRFSREEMEYLKNELAYVHFPGGKKYILGVIIGINSCKSTAASLSWEPCDVQKKIAGRALLRLTVTQSQLKPIRPRGGLKKVGGGMSSYLARCKLRGEAIPVERMERIHAAKWFVLSSDGSRYYIVRSILNDCVRSFCGGQKPCCHNFSCSCPARPKPCKHMFFVKKFAPIIGFNADNNLADWACGGMEGVHRVNKAKWVVQCPETEELLVVRRVDHTCSKSLCRNLVPCAHTFVCGCSRVERPCCHIKMASNNNVEAPPSCTVNITTMQSVLQKKLSEKVTYVGI